MSDAESREFFACFQVLEGFQIDDLNAGKMASIKWSGRFEKRLEESLGAML